MNLETFLPLWWQQSYWKQKLLGNKVDGGEHVRAVCSNLELYDCISCNYHHMNKKQKTLTISVALEISVVFQYCSLATIKKSNAMLVFVSIKALQNALCWSLKLLNKTKTVNYRTRNSEVCSSSMSHSVFESLRLRYTNWILQRTRRITIKNYSTER